MCIRDSNGIITQAQKAKEKTEEAKIRDAEIASQKPSIRSYFLLTLDTQPYYNPQAVALKVDEKLMLQGL